MNNGMRMAGRAVALLVVALLSACGTVAAPTGGVGTATPAATGGDMIVLRTTGTIAGVDREMRISTTGLATVYDRGKQVAMRQMTSTSFEQIQSFLQESDFFNLQDKYDKGGVSDDRYYAITYTQGGRTKTVTTADVGGKDVTPKRILDVIAKLSQFEWQMTYKRQP